VNHRGLKPSARFRRSFSPTNIFESFHIFSKIKHLQPYLLLKHSSIFTLNIGISKGEDGKADYPCKRCQILHLQPIASVIHACREGLKKPGSFEPGCIYNEQDAVYALQVTQPSSMVQTAPSTIVSPLACWRDCWLSTGSTIFPPCFSTVN
jgi:hypothetical protein